MKKWVYTLAVVDLAAIKMEGPGAIRFEHVMVEALNMDAAYEKVHEEAYAIGWLPVKHGELANDYAAEIKL